MGKKTRAATAERERPAEAAALPTLTALVSAVLTPVVLILLIASLDRSEFLYSKKEGRCHFITRLFIWMFLQESVTRALAEVLMPAARRIARFLPGESRPITAQEESEQHDPSLKWPCAGTELPPEWTAAARGKQPYFLNHVRGSVRFRQALLRVAAATGSIVQVFAMAWLIDRRPPEAIGLTLAWVDVALGVFTGVSVIVLLFCAEVALGWLRIVGYFEVVSPNESLHVNLLWDVLFHIGVAVHEEVSHRGWLLVNTAHAWVDHFGVSPAVAMALSVAVQAILFAMAHVGSPGASRAGLTNLVIGGTVGALNVFLTGGLSFALGWHFGWNITMGHLLGLSTSGIPMSAKYVSVVPHPRKAKLHGGQFGPEQSPLAAVAYLLCAVLLVFFYGSSGLEVWQARLASSVSIAAAS